jgi:2-aminoadipate transaminase
MDRSIGGSHGGRRGRETAHELARYEALFAARTRGMKSSAMREMMALTERPDVISLAGGLPDTSTFAPELYAKLMSQVAATSTARALQYGPTEGMAVTVDCIVEVMAAEGTAIDPANVIVTTGGQQVIDLVCKALIDPGDVIVAEAPTYPGAIPTFGAYQADVVQIEIDSDGMPIDELEAVLDRLASEGRRPKFIYTIPNFQNPGGVTMSLPRRRRLIEVARERELLVLEDNPYGLLRYEGEPLPTLYSLDASAGSGGAGGARGGGDGLSSDLVIYLGTFSKILSPGLRLGWAVAPRAVLEKLNLGKQGADLCSSPMTQLFVSAYFAERAADGRSAWIEYVERLRELYRRRRDVMLESLGEHFGGRASWTRPEGGLFIWATLDGVDTTDLMARSKGVAFVPGRSAYMDVDGRRGANSMRLNFAGVPDENIREGIRRISAIARPDTGLMGALTGSSARGTPDRAGAGAARRETQPHGVAEGSGTEAAVADSGAGDEGTQAGAGSRGSATERDADGLAEVLELPRRPEQDSPSRRRQDR